MGYPLENKSKEELKKMVLYSIEKEIRVDEEILNYIVDFIFKKQNELLVYLIDDSMIPHLITDLEAFGKHLQKDFFRLNLSDLTYITYNSKKEILSNSKNVLPKKLHQKFLDYIENTKKLHEITKQENEIIKEKVNLLVKLKRLDEVRVSYKHSVMIGKNKWEEKKFSSNAKIEGIWANVEHFNKVHRKRVYEIIGYASDKRTHETR